MKRSFTKEELDVLAQYEGRFKSSIELDYARNLEPRYLTVIKDIYDAATEGNYSLNMSCSHCVLTFLKTVGKKYFEDKEAYLKKAAELVGALDEIFAEVGEEPEPAPAQDPEPVKPKKRATKKK